MNPKIGPKKMGHPNNNNKKKIKEDFIQNFVFYFYSIELL